jgi:predicted TIM-barrel fold metal-dependent hydrolase
VRIIDVHTHLGYDPVFEVDFTRDELAEELTAKSVDALITQPGTVLDIAEARSQHDAIARFTAEFPGRVFGMANPSPHFDTATYRDELTRCVRELGFVGVKINTFAHSVGVGLPPGRRVLDAARELGIPVMIHTGAGAPWALPSNILPIARDYADLKIVMAHSGAMAYASEALIVAQESPNVYLEVTWTPGYIVRSFVNAIGAARVLFGTDHADNLETELTKLRTAGLSASDLEWCLGRTAEVVYRLPQAESGRSDRGAEQPTVA